MEKHIHVSSGVFSWWEVEHCLALVAQSSLPPLCFCFLFAVYSSSVLLEKKSLWKLLLKQSPGITSRCWGFLCQQQRNLCSCTILWCCVCAASTTRAQEPLPSLTIPALQLPPHVELRFLLSSAPKSLELIWNSSKILQAQFFCVQGDPDFFLASTLVMSGCAAAWVVYNKNSRSGGKYSYTCFVIVVKRENGTAEPQQREGNS